MRIVIDAYQMRHVVTGTDRQARNVLAELQQLDHDNHYTIIVNADEAFVSEVITAANFTLLPLRIRRRATWHLIGLPKLLKDHKAEVFFSFHNFMTPGIKLCRIVVSALDIVPFVYQKSYYRRPVDRWVRRPIVLGLMKLSVRLGDAFLANSEYTKKSIVERFKIRPERVRVAYLQAEKSFFEHQPADRLEAVRRTYHLPEQFIFALGASEPRKNAISVIRAHHGLKPELQRRFPVVVAGAKWQNEDFPIANDPLVQLAGFIEDDDLPAVFQLARVFAYPSRFEGFGLPLLEAMAGGTPTLTSNVTALPEAAGEAAALVDPDDISGMTRALEQILTDEAYRQRLIQAGYLQVQKFSWRANAQTLLELLTKS